MTAERALLAVLNGERRDPPPVWFMRQAGRYLPEYRALRSEKGGFLELVNDSAAAAEITLQPLRRFGFDGAILFSDILVVPSAIGQTLGFETGDGPRLSPSLDRTDLADLKPAPERFDPIYATVRRVAAALPPETTLIGFAGSPWTVASYMVAGEGSRDQMAARLMAYRERRRFEALIGRIVETTVSYLQGQVASGVQAVQLFDSWAGSLAPEEFDSWVIAPTRQIVEAFRAACPGVPVIGFPKGAGGKIADYARATGIDAIGLDETVDPEWADSVLPRALPMQGNLDPALLLAGGPGLERSISRIRAALRGRPHIFNLGHGISKHTPIDHVETAIRAIRRTI